VGHVAGRGGNNLAQFASLVDRMRFETQNLPLHEIVEHVIEASGLIAHYQTEKEGTERIENLRELVNAAAAFASEDGYAADDAGALATTLPETGQVLPSPLAAFLSHAALEAGDNQASLGQDAVQLMTVHAAKGLEFEAVFISGMEEGLFPHENSILEPAGLEEERRLMYVAITRARERLYMSFSQTRMLHGQTRYHMRSRFLTEVPEESLKWLTPKMGLAKGMDTAPAWGRSSAWIDSESADGVSMGRSRGKDVHGYVGAAETYSSRRTAQAGVEVNGKTFMVGQSVAHPRFGEGVIVHLQGAGQDAQVQINFSGSGTKTLALGVAKLDPI